MKKALNSILIPFIALILTFANVPSVSAHTPIGSGDNESLGSATVIPYSDKSWAVYTDLHTSGEAQYYRFEATKGELVPIQLYTSPSKEEAGFTPSFALMGPGIENQAAIPGYVEKPANAGIQLVKGIAPAQATYEAFAPSVFIQVADLSFVAPATGTYFVAVFDELRGGRYGVAIGDAESFTLTQWITTPLAFSSIYAWEGQSVFLVYLPAMLILGLGIALLIGRKRRGQSGLDLIGWVAAVAGLLFLGTGATTTTQMIVSLIRSTPDALVIATVFLAVLPMILGVLTLRLAMRKSGRWTLSSRISLALLGVAALFVWAGFLIGPAMIIVSALIPNKIGLASGVAAPNRDMSHLLPAEKQTLN
jgi:hypothetical protein